VGCRLALFQPVPDEGYCLGGVSRVVPSTVLYEERRLAVGVSVNLYAGKLVRVTDEIDVVVVGWANGSSRSIRCLA
jgi:hypothetical protein